MMIAVGQLLLGIVVAVLEFVQGGNQFYIGWTICIRPHQTVAVKDSHQVPVNNSGITILPTTTLSLAVYLLHATLAHTTRVL